MERSRLVYILLALFLGGLGIHNFYAGYKSKGIKQLLCTFPGILLLGIPTLICTIWVLVDICTVSQDADGKPMK